MPFSAGRGFHLRVAVHLIESRRDDFFLTLGDLLVLIAAATATTAAAACDCEYSNSKGTACTNDISVLAEFLPSRAVA